MADTSDSHGSLSQSWLGRGKAYVDLLTALDSAMELVDHTHPSAGPTLPAPCRPESEIMQEATEAAESGATQEIRSLFARWCQLHHDFFLAAERLRDLAQQHAYCSGHEDHGYKEVLTKQLRELREARQALQALAAQLRRRIGEELDVALSPRSH